MAKIKSIMQRKKAKLSQKQRERTKKDEMKVEIVPKSMGTLRKQDWKRNHQDILSSKTETFRGRGEAWATAGNFCNI